VGNPNLKLRDQAGLVGWQTPRVTTGKYCYRRGNPDDPVLTLEGQADLASWATPMALHNKRSKKFLKGREPGPEEVGIVGWQTPKASDSKSPGKSRDVHLNHQAALVNWPAPNAQDTRDGKKMRNVTRGAPQRGVSLHHAAERVASWPATTEQDAKEDNWTDNAYLEAVKEGKTPPSTSQRLRSVVKTAPWTTPTKDDVTQRKKKYAQRGSSLSYQTSGLTPSPSTVTTKSGDGSPQPRKAMLNPYFSLWLQGFPAGWAYSGERAIASCRRSRR
ncbi:unnamed protein product, partial [marine sediment metagenome]